MDPERGGYIEAITWPSPLPSTDAEPLRRNPTVVAAIITGLLTLIGTIVTVGIPLIKKLPAVEFFPGSNQQSCVQLTIEYRNLLRENPGLVDALLLPGPNGVSILAKDERAQRCGIGEAALRRMAQQ